ncbi:MAG: hypothetical protein AB7Q81_12445 [Gammaproteobacteria bacterium]
MIKMLVRANLLLTLPFGVAALVNPEPLFLQFGVALSAPGALVARGYAATLIGYGILLWGVREVVDPDVLPALLLSIVLFNGLEAAVQAIAAVQGVAAGAIYLNVAIHLLVTAWAIVLLVHTFRVRARRRHG